MLYIFLICKHWTDAIRSPWKKEAKCDLVALMPRCDKPFLRKPNLPLCDILSSKSRDSLCMTLTQGQAFLHATSFNTDMILTS